MDIILDLKEFTRSVRKKWWLVLAFFAVGIIAAVLNLILQKPVYTAGASFIVNSADTLQSVDTLDSTGTRQYVYTCENLLLSNKVMSAAASAAALPLKLSQLDQMVTAKVLPESSIVSFQVTADDARDAVTLTEKLIEETKNNISLIKSTTPIQITVMDRPAVVPQEGIVSRAVKALLIGGLAGILIALAVLLFREALSSKIRREEIAKKVTGLDSMGIIPQGGADLADAFRSVRANIRSVAASGSCIAVTSPAPMEGRTFTAKKLAEAFAESGFKTLLLEADFRKPSFASFLKSPSAKGLADYLSAGAEPEDAVSPLLKNLDAVAAGGSAPEHVDLLDSVRMESLLALLRKKYDYIILDTPALNLTPEAVVLSRFADSALLLLKFASTKQKAAAAAAEKLRRGGANVTGFLLGSIEEDLYADMFDEKNRYYR